jgi:hypothetical protein
MNSNSGRIGPFVFEGSKAKLKADFLLKGRKLLEGLISDGEGRGLPDRPLWKQEIKKEKTSEKKERRATPSHRKPLINPVRKKGALTPPFL